MLKLKPYEFWFLIGSQHLYGEEALKQVQRHSVEMVTNLNNEGQLPFKIVCKPVLTTSDAIRQLILEANANEHCAGIITWMHTFSPAKMWIVGLNELRKPLLHFHTQFNRDIPWTSIDMDFMNLNQSAHGDREFGFIVSRMNIPRKVVVGYWQDPIVVEKIGKWMRLAVGYTEGKAIKVARFGDNMRNVAVTEGDKVEAQIKFGWSVDYFGIGDLVEYIENIPKQKVAKLIEEYKEIYDMDSISQGSSDYYESISEQARIELGLRAFLEEGQYTAFTTNFEDLHGMKQLPGLAVQRLMADGYGFGGEGDWKTAALVRLLKIISNNRATSFIEDYTYHFEPGNEMTLGSHMLEVCPTVSSTKPKVVVSPLSIGGKSDPARLVFDGVEGPAINASLIDLGHRFRLVINEVEAVKPLRETPSLPVAKILWKPLPSLYEATESWIYAGGSHHAVFSKYVDSDQLEDWANLVGIECVVIDKNTTPQRMQKELRWNEAVWK